MLLKKGGADNFQNEGFLNCCYNKGIEYNVKPSNTGLLHNARQALEKIQHDTAAIWLQCSISIDFIRDTMSAIISVTLKKKCINFLFMYTIFFS